MAQEFKDNKPNLSQYFTTQRFEKLMNYVLIDHNKLEERKIAYKFPLTSAEILSSPNPKISEFFGTKSDSGVLIYFERLFSGMVDRSYKVTNDEINFTRAGYITKIITNLITTNPQVFCDYIFKKPIFIDAMIKHSYCKSISMLLLSLLALPQQDITTSNIGITDVNPNTGWLKEVLIARLDVFKRILDETVQISHMKGYNDASTNLCNLIINILSKDHSEKEDFLRAFTTLYLDTVIELFADSYPTGVNNRLGNVFLVVLDILIRDNDKHKYISPSKFAAFFQKYAGLIVNHSKPSTNSNKQRKVISTFSSELDKTNINVYKVLEALYMLIKYLKAASKDQLIIDAALHKHIFSYYANYPFNNVLHNQLQKILIFIIETSNNKLINIFFIENPFFYHLLENLLTVIKDNECMRKSRKGYFGHVKALANSLLVFETKTGTPLTRKLTRPDMATVH